MDNETILTNSKERVLVECYSRVCGYIRPVQQWNGAKQAEFSDRKTFDEALK